MLGETIQHLVSTANPNGCVGDKVVVSRSALERLEAMAAGAVLLEQTADFLGRSTRCDDDLMGKTIRLTDPKNASLAVTLAEQARRAILCVPVKGLPFVPVDLYYVEKMAIAGLRCGIALDRVRKLLDVHLPHASIVSVELGSVREDKVRRLCVDDVVPSRYVGVAVFSTKGQAENVVHFQLCQDIDGGDLPTHDVELFTIRTYGGFAETQEIVRLLTYAVGVA